MKGVSMGSTVYRLVGKTFLQLYEHLIVKHKKETNNIILYNRYKDDVTNS